MPSGTEADRIGTAYVEAVVQVPEKLEEIVNLLDAITGCLVVLTDIIRQRAVADKVIEFDEYRKEMDALRAVEEDDETEPAAN